VNRRVWAVAALVFASRLPFLGPGYGADADAWLVAWAGRSIALSGHYEASRLPGYPLHEFVTALIWRFGAWPANALTAAFSAVASACFAIVLRRLGSRDDVLGALALASAPVVYIASVQAMDYTWGLAFALGALALALDRRAAWAGVLAGLAIGCRITWGAFLVPLSLVLTHASLPGARARAVGTACTIALAVAAIAFAPVVLTYGPAFFRFYEHAYPSWLVVAKHATLDLFGLVGLVAIVGAVAWRALRQSREPSSTPDARSARLVTAWVAGIALYLVAFLRLPIDAAYLIPTVPLVLLLFAGFLGRRSFQIVCVALIVSPWLLDVSRPDRYDAPPSAHELARFAGGKLALDLRGSLLAEQARRQERVRILARAFARMRSLGGETIVVAWDWLPEIRVRLGDTREGGVRYVYGITLAELREARSHGTRVAYLPGADWATEQNQGFDLATEGAEALK
jgi:hypothetical protein